MAEITIIPLLNAQEQSMAPLAQTAAARPEITQATVQHLAQEMLKQEANQVQRLEETDRSSLVDGEKEGHGQEFSDSSRQKRRKKNADAEPAPSIDPLVGKLLNVRV